jgi:hypothetical protein
MSLGTQETATYLTLRKGKLCQNVPEGTQGAISRKKSDGTFAYEKQYNFIEGHIIDIKRKNTDWQDEQGRPTVIKSWVLTVIDESWIKYLVEINYNSSYAKNFLSRIPNIDFSEKVRLLVGESPNENDKTKMKGWLSVSQTRQKIPSAYTREEPGRLPQLETREENGKTIYNDDKMMAFYEELVEFHKVAFRHPDGTYTYPAIIPEEKSGNQAIEKEQQQVDDLPF